MDEVKDNRDKTYAEMAGVVMEIRAEVKRRNPIGVNFYIPAIDVPSGR